MSTRIAVTVASLIIAVFFVLYEAVAAQVPEDVVRMAPFQSRLGVRIEDWLAKKGDPVNAMMPDLDDSKWRPVKIGQSWKDSSTCWFRTKFTVPQSEHGKAIFIEVGVDDAAMVYVDGEMLMQLSGFGSTLLTDSATGGRTYSLAVRAVNLGGVGALTVASYRSLASEKLISIENTLVQLAKMKSANVLKIGGWLYKPSGGKANAAVDADTSDWQKVYLPHKMPKDRAFGWYRTEFTVPDTINGFEYLDGLSYFDFNTRTMGDLYVNGKKIKGFQNHLKLNVPRKMKAGDSVVFAVKVTDLSSQGSLRGASLRTAKLDSVVELAGELEEKLKIARLFIEQHPDPPQRILSAVAEIERSMNWVSGSRDIGEVAAKLKEMLRSMTPLEEALVAYPLFHQGPYLQNSRPDGMTVMWETVVPAPSAVYYGKNSLEKVAEDLEPKTIHEIVITGLEPETEYRYMAVSSKLAAPESAFKTSIRRDTPYVFTVWGDNRTDPKSHESVIDAMIPHDPDIALNVGDVVTTGINYNEWSEEYFLPMRRLGIDTPTYISIGNHEYGGYGYGNPVIWFEKFVSHPAPNDYYFSFTYGNSYFMMLNPQDEAGPHNIRPGTEQYEWMINEFESDTYRNAEFKFVFFHEPPYSECWSGGYYDGEPALRANLVPLLEKYGMDIVFAGHTHDYERGQYPKPDGPYYIITGGGGSSLDDQKTKEWEQIEFYAFKYHFSKVTIDGPRLLFEAIDRNGKIFDKFEIVN
ncbi:metallophosphoesterase [bacterium]